MRVAGELPTGEEGVPRSTEFLQCGFSFYRTLSCMDGTSLPMMLIFQRSPQGIVFEVCCILLYTFECCSGDATSLPAGGLCGCIYWD